MAEPVRVAGVNEIAVGAMRLVEVAGEPVVVSNVDGVFFAFSATCTHDDGPLAEGELTGEHVTCPWHFSRFNVKTGEVVDSPSAGADHHLRRSGRRRLGVRGGAQWVHRGDRRVAWPHARGRPRAPVAVSNGWRESATR